jgi:hypothetical protein
MEAQNPVFGGKKSRKRLRRPFSADISVNLLRRIAPHRQISGACQAIMRRDTQSESRNAWTENGVNAAFKPDLIQMRISATRALLG